MYKKEDKGRQSIEASEGNFIRWKNVNIFFFFLETHYSSLLLNCERKILLKKTFSVDNNPSTIVVNLNILYVFFMKLFKIQSIVINMLFWLYFVFNWEMYLLIETKNTF